MKQLGTEEDAVSEMFAVPLESSCFLSRICNFVVFFHLHVQDFLELFAFYDEM